MLTYIDKSSDSFIGYNDELEFLLSIKNNDFDKSKELSNKILNNINISKNIKERVRKLNEIEKYQ